MSVSEAQAEIRTRYQQAKAIEDRYPDGPITNNEDEVEVKRLLTEIDGLETRLATLEDAEQRKARILGNVEKYNRPAEPMRHASGDPDREREDGKSIGQLFVEHPEYARVKGMGMFSSPNNVVTFVVPLSPAKSNLVDIARMQRKALVYSGTGVGGPLIVEDRRPGVIPLELNEPTLLDVLSRTTTDSNSIEYVRLATFTSGAAAVAEASVTTGTTGLKPEAALTLSEATAPVKTIAHWMPVTNQLLADAPAIRGLIDQHLLLGLELELEEQVISGAGGGDLTGILNTTDVQSYGAASSNNVADAILHARALVRVVGKTIPNAVIMHPYDWEAVRIMRENSASATLGGYLIGPPTMAGPMTLWGMPVIEAQGIAENTALVGDFQRGAMLFMREEAQIRVGVINDQFVRNMQTILAELRAAFAVFRPKSFVKVTGV